MAQADFHYDTPAAHDARGMALVVSIFADRPHLCAEMREDCEAAGLRIGTVGEIEDLLAGDALPLGEIVLVDCPQANPSIAAALTRLDMRAARSDAQLVVSTTVDSLDEVFACLDQAQPQILVDPGRAERVIAIGRALSSFSSLRLRELTEEDRLTLLRLTEQVGQIAERLDGSGAMRGRVRGDAAFRFESPVSGFHPLLDSGDRLVQPKRKSHPDPALVRRVIRNRQARSRFFDAELFADPAWDMLLDLTAAKGEKQNVSVTSLCIASGVPPTTALRWISQMTEAGLLMRVNDKSDKRRAFIALTDKAAEAMNLYFAEFGKGAALMA